MHLWYMWVIKFMSISKYYFISSPSYNAKPTSNIIKCANLKCNKHVVMLLKITWSRTTVSSHIRVHCAFNYIQHFRDSFRKHTEQTVTHITTETGVEYSRGFLHSFCVVPQLWTNYRQQIQNKSICCLFIVSHLLNILTDLSVFIQPKHKNFPHILIIT